MQQQDPTKISILGVPIHHVSMGDTLQLVSRWMGEPRTDTPLRQICTANPEFVMKAQQDQLFLDVLGRADLCLADGIGLVYASRWQGSAVPERVPGSELVYHLAKLCAENGWRLFLLGAAEGVAAEAAEKLQNLYPGLQIAGTWSGSPALEENESIVSKIEAGNTDVLYVAFGAPNQDKWIDRNKGSLTSVGLALGIGGSLDFITGRSTRAPEWVQSLGLEWLHRLWKEPWRWRRMLVLPKFLHLALLQAIKQR